MKRALGLLLVGLVALVVQGALSTFLPHPWCPDLGLLSVVGMGLCVEGGGGLLVAALLGYAADVLSGSLLGQHALLRILAYAATRVANLQLHLGRRLPQALFAVLVTAANALALVGLSRLFGGQGAVDSALLRELWPQALVNALCAPPIFRVVERVARVLSDDEGRRREGRLRTSGEAA